MIYQLDPEYPYFPNPLDVPEENREEDSLFAVGGDLSPERLLQAYSSGIFPWTDFRILDVPDVEEREWWQQLHWHCPYDRFVIFPEEIHISHSLRTRLKKGEYRTTFDLVFDEVIAGCSKLRIDEPGAWLGPQMVEAYTRLYHIGYAHSVEVWTGDELAGGLYGVMLNGVFCGESMFSLKPDASKVALVALADRMIRAGAKIIDCQFETPHLRSMGGRHITLKQYLEIMNSTE